MTMRKITEQAVNAFLNGKNWHGSNTHVEVNPMDGTADMYLHGNHIAHRDHVTGVIKGTLAGWPTPTTRDRLNGIAQYVGGCGVFQRGGVQFTDDNMWLQSNQWFVIKS